MNEINNKQKGGLNYGVWVLMGKWLNFNEYLSYEKNPLL